MFSRGNATSGAPICSGMSALAKPANSGVANSSSMIVPCIVNSWLYCSGLSTNCRPGLDQLGADEQRQDAAEDEEDERGDEVEVADHLVVGRGDPLDDGGALGDDAADVCPVHRRCAASWSRMRHSSSVTSVRWARSWSSSISSSRLSVLSSRPVLPGGFSSPMCWSYSARGDDLDVEEHLRVVGAAQLGALALEGAVLGRDHLELVDPPRDHVHLGRNAGTQNEWMTSREVSTNSTRLPTGR